MGTARSTWWTTGGTLYSLADRWLHLADRESRCRTADRLGSRAAQPDQDPIQTANDRHRVPNQYRRPHPLRVGAAVSRSTHVRCISTACLGASLREPTSVHLDRYVTERVPAQRNASLSTQRREEPSGVQGLLLW